MQRFKAALTSGRQNPNNPEDLVRDKNGEFVKFEDTKEEIQNLRYIVQSLMEYIDKIPIEITDKLPAISEIHRKWIEDVLERNSNL